MSQPEPHRSGVVVPKVGGGCPLTPWGPLGMYFPRPFPGSWSPML